MNECTLSIQSWHSAQQTYVFRNIGASGVHIVAVRNKFQRNCDTLYEQFHCVKIAVSAHNCTQFRFMLMKVQRHR